MTNSQPDLARLERRAYRTLWDDGLVDLFFGLGILGTGLAWIAGTAVFGAFLPALLVPLWAAARKRLAEPRAGYVRLAPQRRARTQRRLLGLALLGAVVLLLAVAAWLLARGAAPGDDGIVRAAVPALPAALLGLGSALVGWAFDVRRFLVHAAVLLLCGAGGALLRVDPGWHLLAAGACVTVVGGTLLASFLRNRPPAEAASAP